ncbi:MAG TPA: helix-turn-helix transcriptional regulator [Vicinamibacteria bacterium]
MKPTVFLILVALGERERHGYGLVKAIESRAPGTRIEPANLYRTLRAMKRDGLITESGRRPDPELDDARRVYFRITDKGARLARAEAERLSKLVRLAKKLRALSTGSS